MDLRKLKTLIDLVSESNVSELEITEPEGKVRIVKAVGAPMVMAQPGNGSHVMPYSMGSAPVSMTNQPLVTESIESVAIQKEVATEPVGHIVKSPMVGTFYRSANPGSAPMAEVGGQIKAGEAICIVEAMKIMNEIESDQTGRVTKILVDNGQAVEYGQALFVIE